MRARGSGMHCVQRTTASPAETLAEALGLGRKTELETGLAPRSERVNSEQQSVTDGAPRWELGAILATIRLSEIPLKTCSLKFLF